MPDFLGEAMLLEDIILKNFIQGTLYFLAILIMYFCSDLINHFEHTSHYRQINSAQ